MQTRTVISLSGAQAELCLNPETPAASVGGVLTVLLRATQSCSELLRAVRSYSGLLRGLPRVPASLHTTSVPLHHGCQSLLNGSDEGRMEAAAKLLTRTNNSLSMLVILQLFAVIKQLSNTSNDNLRSE